MAKSLIRVLDDGTGDDDKLDPGWCLVAFGARWCAPFMQLGPILEALAKKYADQVVVYTYNVDQFNVRTQRYDVKGIPTMHLIHAGFSRERLEGFRSFDMIEAVILKHLKPAQPAVEVVCAETV